MKVKCVNTNKGFIHCLAQRKIYKSVKHIIINMATRTQELIRSSSEGFRKRQKTMPSAALA